MRQILAPRPPSRTRILPSRTLVRGSAAGSLLSAAPSHSYLWLDNESSAGRLSLRARVQADGHGKCSSGSLVVRTLTNHIKFLVSEPFESCLTLRLPDCDTHWLVIRIQVLFFWNRSHGVIRPVQVDFEQGIRILRSRSACLKAESVC